MKNTIIKLLSACCIVLSVTLVILLLLIFKGNSNTTTPFVSNNNTNNSTQNIQVQVSDQEQTKLPQNHTPTLSVTYTEKEETVYATTNVNIRKGPGIKYEILGLLKADKSILRIATGSNGWSKVMYNNNICYISSEYLTAEKPIHLNNGRITINPEQELWNLVVVNSGREIPEGYEPKLAEVADTGVYMDYRVAPFYTKMYYAAKKDGINLTPYSGYRSYDRQKRNYNNLTNSYMTQYGISREEAAKKAATVILPPGTSEHNLGLAMDICNTKDSFANQKEYKWLTENAHKFGFILRYTAEKQPITGIVPEPWHWRYVGVEYAEKIKDSGLCLEEYLDSVGIAY